MEDKNQKVTAANAGDENDRSVATTQIVDFVLRSQHDPQETNPGMTQNTPSSLLVYVLERLIGGLCSGRHLSHVGFSATLAVLLRDVECLSVENVLDVMKQKITLPSGMRGEEFRDNAIGRTLCCAAIIKSGVFDRDTAMILEIAKELTSIYERKAAMREMCSALLVDLFNNLDLELVKSIFDSCLQLQEVLLQDPEDAETEAIFLCLSLWGSLPNKILSRCQLLPKVSEVPARQWVDMNGKLPYTTNEASKKFFSLEHFQKIEDSLKRSSQSHPHMHSVWKPVLRLLLPSCGSSSQATASPETEWPHDVCEESLYVFWRKFLTSGLLGSTEERQFLAHRLMQILLPHIPVEHLPVVLGDECVRQISRQAQAESHRLQASAKECLDAICTRLSHTSDRLLSGPLVLMLKRLAKYQGLKDVCHAILAKTQSSATNKYLTTLMNYFVNAKDATALQQLAADDSDDGLPSGGGVFSLKEASRDEILDELRKTTKSVQLTVDEAVHVARFLLANGLFELDSQVCYSEQALEEASKCSPPVTPETKQLCCQCLVSMLPTLQWAVAKCETKEEVLLAGINQFVVDCKESNGVDLVADYGEREEACHQTLAELTGYLTDLLADKRKKMEETGSSKDCKKLDSLLLLCSVLSLYLWIVPGSVHSDTVDDLARFVAEAFGGEVEEISESDSDVSLDEERSPGDKGVSKAGVATVVKEKGRYTDSLASMMLGISSRTTAPLKGKLLHDTAIFVFNSFGSDMQVSGWLDILTAMNQFMQARGIDSESDDEDDTSGMDETLPMPGAIDESEEEDHSLEASPSNKTGTELSFDEISDGSESIDEAGPDDATMFQMDSALAAVFRSKRDEREQQLGNLLTFFTTMLSCVKQHLRFHQKSPVTAFAAAELSSLFSKLDGKDGFKSVAKTVDSCMRLSLKCKPSLTNDLIPLLEEHTVRCLKAVSKDKVDKQGRKHIQHALKFMVRCLDRHNHDASTRIMKRILHSVFDKTGKRLDISVASELLSEVQSLRMTVLPEIIEFSSTARNSFLKIQAMKLVVTCLGDKNMEQVSKCLWPLLPALHSLFMYCASLSFEHRDRNIAALFEATRIVKSIKRLWLVGRPDVLKFLRLKDVLAKLEEKIDESQEQSKVVVKLKALKAALDFDTALQTTPSKPPRSTVKVGLRGKFAANGNRKIVRKTMKKTKK